MKLKKISYTIACISALISTPLYAQVSEAEFEALLNQNRESSRTGENQPDNTVAIEVVEISPEHLFHDIDTNRIEVDALQSEIEVLEAKRQILSLKNEIKKLENGYVESPDNDRPNSGFIDSTMSSPEPAPKVEDRNEDMERIRGLEAQLASLEENLTAQLESHVQALQAQAPPAVEEETETIIEEPALFKAISDQYSVVSTTNINGSPRARLASFQGKSHDVRVGSVFGYYSLEVVSINHGEVVVKREDGNLITLTPINLDINMTYIQNSIPNVMGSSSGEDLGDQQYMPVSDSVRN